MSQSNYITLALFAVIGLIFLIDFIKNNSKKSIDKSVEKFVEKEDKKTNSSNPIDWILNRKKNIALFIILLSISKLCLNYFVYPIHLGLVEFTEYDSKQQFRSNQYWLKNNPPINNKYEKQIPYNSHYLKRAEMFKKGSRTIIIWLDPNDLHAGFYYSTDRDTSLPGVKQAGFSVHLENIFSYDLFLFLPCSIFFLIVVWFFNDKIKAQ